MTGPNFLLRLDFLEKYIKNKDNFEKQIYIKNLQILKKQINESYLKIQKDEEWVKSFIKNIKEKGYHYYLSAWDSRSNLNKFAELTAKGLVFLWD